MSKYDYVDLDKFSDDEQPELEFMCPDCKEWTIQSDSCCGVGPADFDEDTFKYEV